MKNMTINDIIAFISEAQKEKATVTICSTDKINIWNDKNKHCQIFINRNSKKLGVINNCGKFEINLSESDIHLYDVLVDTIKRYSENNAIKQFESFFKTEEDTPKEATIYDLDDDE